ncbi:uncharacterized protein LOC119726107 [Patiria miniata]|uniref:Uncharacterized protein n=1 Tax=Patiria miniata TaxID=46514 RepID=A0A913ZPJ5_PATMI|nr:uncharacterized protein LOC119726107 [Patiria miniata]XP_038053648.1 uncharacterized protein LOC119726107 [Patiria miniata]
MPSPPPSPQFPYNMLDETGKRDSLPRPGTFFVTTLTTPTGDMKPRDKSASAESGTEAGCEEPQCEIIVHTAQQDPPPTQYASDHCTLSLFVFLCCFLPFGLVGMIKNHESRVKAVAGDYDGAVAASRVALKYAVAGCIIGTVCYLAFAAFGMAVLVLTLTGQA